MVPPPEAVEPPEKDDAEITNLLRHAVTISMGGGGTRGRMKE